VQKRETEVGAREEALERKLTSYRDMASI